MTDLNMLLSCFREKMSGARIAMLSKTLFVLAGSRVGSSSFANVTLMDVNVLFVICNGVGWSNHPRPRFSTCPLPTAQSTRPVTREMLPGPSLSLSAETCTSHTNFVDNPKIMCILRNGLCNKASCLQNRVVQLDFTPEIKVLCVK